MEITNEASSQESNSVQFVEGSSQDTISTKDSEDSEELLLDSQKSSLKSKLSEAEIVKLKNMVPKLSFISEDGKRYKIDENGNIKVVKPGVYLNLGGFAEFLDSHIG